MTSDISVPVRYNAAIRELPASDRPRERLLQYGAGVLSSAELLAILLRTGTRERSAIGLAEQLISHFNGLRGISIAGVGGLTQIKGVGQTKAVEIMAAVELGKRLAVINADDRPSITGPEDVANILMPEMRDLTQEHLRVLLLDVKNRLVRTSSVTVGTHNSAPVYISGIFREAIQVNAASIILVHNHPSGDPTPSRDDQLVTNRVQEAGKLIDIQLLDHIVIGHNCWISLKERRLMD